MDFNDSSNESFNFSNNMTKEKNKTIPVGFISSTSETKTAEIDLNGFSDSNDRISDISSDSSFHSVNGTVNDVIDSNIDKSNNDSNLIRDDENEKNVLKDDFDECFGSDELKQLSNPASTIEKSVTPTREMKTDDGNAATGDVADKCPILDIAIEDCAADEQLTDSLTNLPYDAVENSVRDEREKSGLNVIKNEADSSHESYDNQMTEDSQTSTVDEADESFSLDEVLEESECSEKDQTRGNSSNEQHLAFDENSVTSIPPDNLESMTCEKDDQQSTAYERLQAGESPSNNEPVVSHDEVEDHSIGQEVVEEKFTLENCEVQENPADIGQDFLPKIVRSLVNSSIVESEIKYEVSPEKKKDCRNYGESPSKENSSEASDKEHETVDSSLIFDNITIKISPNKNQRQRKEPNNHESSSPIVTQEKFDQHSATHDSNKKVLSDQHEVQENSVNDDLLTCLEDFTEVSKDSVPSSHGESVPTSEESTNTLPVVSGTQNEKEAFIENSETTTNPEECSQKELVSDSTQKLLTNLRRRVSSRHRNNSDSNEPALIDADASLPGQSGSSMRTRKRTKDQRSPSKSTFNSPRSRSNWRPQINSVMSASDDFSIRVNKLTQNVSSDPDIKEEVTDESYGIDYSTKEKFNLVDFCIKLEKIDMDSEVEVLLSSPRRARQAPRRSLENNASSRTRIRSEMLRNRMRSRTANSRSRLSDRKICRPSATRSAARSGDANRRHINGQVSTRIVGRSGGEGVTRINGVAKNAERSAGRETKEPSKVSTRSDDDNRRNLRSTGVNAGNQDRDRIDFLRLLNLRSRKGDSDDKVKGILVKPKINKTPSKRVSFQLPDESASKEPNNSSKERDTPSKSEPRVSSRSAKVDGFSRSAKVDGSSRSVKVDGSSRSPKVDGSSRLPKVDGSSRSVKVDGSSRLTKVDGPSRSAKVDGPSRSAKVDGSSRLAKVDGPSRSVKVDGSLRLAKVDGSSRLTKVDESSRSTKVNGSSRSAKVDGSSRSAKVDGSSRSAKVDGSSRLTVRKRKIISTRSNRNRVPILPKKSRSSSNVAEEPIIESEEEVIDENPFDKLESVAEACRKTLDVWYECQCCNQKYYFIENAKQHVRTHFPNCLTN